MREKMLQKLDTEYEFFFLEAMRNSKANLFAKSLEIEMKKEIQGYLRDFIKSSDILHDARSARQLYLTDNLMDECYRFALDHPEQDIGENCKTYIFQKISDK